MLDGTPVIFSAVAELEDFDEVARAEELDDFDELVELDKLEELEELRDPVAVSAVGMLAVAALEELLSVPLPEHATSEVAINAKKAKRICDVQL